MKYETVIVRRTSRNLYGTSKCGSEDPCIIKKKIKREITEEGEKRHRLKIRKKFSHVHRRDTFRKRLGNRLDSRRYIKNPETCNEGVI